MSGGGVEKEKIEGKRRRLEEKKKRKGKGVPPTN